MIPLRTLPSAPEERGVRVVCAVSRTAVPVCLLLMKLKVEKVRVHTCMAMVGIMGCVSWKHGGFVLLYFLGRGGGTVL
jgi:hypothetical protein